MKHNASFYKLCDRDGYNMIRNRSIQKSRALFTSYSSVVTLSNLKKINKNSLYY